MSLYTPVHTPRFINFMISLILQLPEQKQAELDKMFSDDVQEASLFISLKDLAKDNMHTFAESIGLPSWSLSPNDIQGEISGVYEWIKGHRFQRTGGIGINFCADPVQTAHLQA